MALTDEQEKALREELEAKQKQLNDILEAQKLAKVTDDKEKERDGKGKKETPTQPKLDPDTVKDIAQLKQDMAEIKAALGNKGSVKKADLFSWNIFGE